MRILVCDDEKIICDSLQIMLKEYFEQENIDDIKIVNYQSGEDLLSDRGQKDIVFLDVKLGGKDGIAVGKELKKRNPKTIIFIITAFDEYTDDAFRMHAFRFFKKPIDKERLFINLKEALTQYCTAYGKISIEDNHSLYSPYKTDVIFIESKDRGSIVHTRGGKYYSSNNIESWLKILKEECFYHSHRSFIVNMDYISEITADLIRFENYDSCAYLTKRDYKKFNAVYSRYLKMKK